MKSRKFLFHIEHCSVLFLAAVCLAASLGAGLPSQALNLLVPNAYAADTDAQAPVFMFVQISESMRADTKAQTLRLVDVNQQTLYFSDRPERIAGHVNMVDYMKEWTTVKDDFDEDPPNASLSVYEGGEAVNTVAIIELTNPVIDGADLVYNYTLIEGVVPEEGGQTALFIDRIGVGGGVGVGYHGVGVGRRGPGVR